MYISQRKLWFMSIMFENRVCHNKTKVYFSMHKKCKFMPQMIVKLCNYAIIVHCWCHFVHKIKNKDKNEGVNNIIGKFNTRFK